MTTEKIVSNYTPEQTANAVIDYLAGTSVELIAERLGKSPLSVIAKLSREKVYVAKTHVSKVRTLTKAQLVTQIEVLKEFTPGFLKSLEKADKPALEALLRTM